jgi:hypothetical protein
MVDKRSEVSTWTGLASVAVAPQIELETAERPRGRNAITVMIQNEFGPVSCLRQEHKHSSSDLALKKWRFGNGAPSDPRSLQMELGCDL